MIQGVEQGECENCGESDDNYSKLSRTYHDKPPHDADDDVTWDGIEYKVMCDCGEEASVSITEEGLETTGPITHENASWNEGNDES